MALFREEDRHPIDPRVLIVRNPADLRIWQDREFCAANNIHGLIYDMGISPADLKRAAGDLVHLAKTSDDFSRKFQDVYAPRQQLYAGEPWIQRSANRHMVASANDIIAISDDQDDIGLFVMGGDTFFSYKTDEGERLFSTSIMGLFNLHSCSTTTKDILHGVFKGALSLGRRFRDVSALFRVNSTFPEYFHRHTEPEDSPSIYDVLTFSFSQNGTICQAEDGTEYIVEAGKALVADAEISHKGADYNDDWADNPRVTLLCSPRF